MIKKYLPRLLFVILSFIFIPLGVHLLEQETHIISRAIGKKASLFIDVGISYEEKPGVWENLAQGGEEQGRMLEPVIGRLKDLDTEYIRIDHIYDFYNVVDRDSEGRLTYNWTNLDLTVNDILASGSKPFFSLSYMPPAISKKEIVDLPSNWNDWEEVVQKTVEHYSGRDGLAIPDVYYEVWNEPDLFGNFKTYGSENYLELYLHAVRGADKAENVLAYKIGGPATTKLYKNWFNNFLGYTRSNNLRVDFYSWHLFSKHLDEYETDVRNARKWLGRFDEYKDLELIISELGHDSNNHKGYDSNFGAIHTIALSALLEGRIDKSFIFEVKDGPGAKKHWGRWGILTHEKFGVPEPKPRYWAIEFLNRVQGERVNIAGEGSWVKAFAKQEGQVTRILVVNYDPLGKHSESVPIALTNLPSREFTFRRVDFQGGEKESNIVSQTDVWRTIEYFDPNSAVIFEIIPR
jgi:hypothetical protein